MTRTVGVGLGIGLAVVVSALLVWRCGRTPERSTAPGTQAAPSAGAGSSQRRLVGPGRDGKSLTRSSLAGTVTDAVTKAPIAGAEVCADGCRPISPTS